ncbi:amino acid ABC transporter permease [Jiella endophytica]|nr:amino acid ABC transporter permease [Jiella endophytica]
MMWDRLVEEAPRFFTYWNLRFFVEAALTTLALSVTGSVFGALVGFVLAVTRMTRGGVLLPVRILAIVVTEFFRRVPFLVTLMLVFFVSQMSGNEWPLFAIAAMSVFLIAAAYLAEIIRSGLLSVHHNQWDAAAAMNFSLGQTIFHVILPQAWRIILPPAFGFFVLFIKDTALASQIGVTELTFAGKVLNNRGFSATLSFGTVLLFYFLLSYPLSLIGARLEARLAATRNRQS